MNAQVKIKDCPDARGYFPGCVKISQHFRKNRALAYFAIRQKVKGKYSPTVRIAPNRTVELINGRTPKTIDIDVKLKGIAYLGGLLDSVSQAHPSP
nr:13829_t:CDS:2 [Entrophospora candida]CAG8437130.1 8070_t:CDS:2 [Entrophospora candida]